jgi:hypothetical protein
MDDLAKWSAHIVDLRTLFSEWERRNVEGYRWTRRFREIHSVCMFTLLIENGNNQRYLIGFQEKGHEIASVNVNRLFDDDFGEVEDCDVLLIDDPKKYGESQVLHHRCQLVSYINQPSTSEVDFINFLERKKLKVPLDPDLRLVIHIEQEGPFNFGILSIYLNSRSPKCPYSEVFVFGQNSIAPRRWFCVKVYPGLASFPELDEQTAKDLVIDREQYILKLNTELRRKE